MFPFASKGLPAYAFSFRNISFGNDRPAYWRDFDHVRRTYDTLSNVEC